MPLATTAAVDYPADQLLGELPIAAASSCVCGQIIKSGELLDPPPSVPLHRRGEVNRKNKGVQKIFHCAGTQTFADICEAKLRISGESMDHSSLFIVTHTKKDGTPVNSECAVAIALKQSQSSASSSQMVASKNDIYCQVLGEDKPGRVRGLGTGPTPATLWGRPTNFLNEENKMLGVRVKDLEERIAKLEGKVSKFQEENDSVDGGVASISSSPKESANVTKKDGESLTVKRVKLLDMDGQQVGVGIVMSVDPNKMVMERPIGNMLKCMFQRANYLMVSISCGY